MLAESIHEKNSVEMIIIEGTNGENSGVERVDLLYDMTHYSAQTELGVKGFGDEGDLSVGAKVLVVLAKSTEDGGSGEKVGNNLIVGARDMLEHEGFQGPIMSLPCMVAFAINSDIRLWERSIKPIGKSMAISNKHHLEAPFLPIGFGPIKA
jgi:hypothetical protein